MPLKRSHLISRSTGFCPGTGRPVRALKKWAVPFFGLLALIWILVRVIPKPQRAAYPCMKVAFPFATSFLIYMGSLFASAVVFRKAIRNLSGNRFLLAGMLLLAGIGFSILTMVSNKQDAFAGGTATYDFEDPLGPNNPIGKAKGILPGRVVWVHNPDATNEDCIPWEYGDGYFLDKNADQDLVDEMLRNAILKVTGETSEEEAWNSVFTYFNIHHGKGDTRYSAGEKIFIKINAVHAWTTNQDLSIRNDGNYGNVDTSPQVILAVLRQLINRAGVPQDAIYIGDPYTQIFKHIHDKLSAEFPGVHYMSKSDHPDREQLQNTSSEEIVYSDRGTILDKPTDGFFDCIVDADYVLSVPAIKGHRWGGVTFFAKNHFGSNINGGASHLHKGLHRTDYEAPLRDGYREYRVFVDIMGYEHLGGKTLIYIGDFLWGTSYEHDPPVKFRSAPFHDDWSSSVLVSLDPVAVASVALDILQEEFQVEDLTTTPPRYTYVRFGGMDDYLHQAASSDWWPEGITYDPENDGTPVESLGVHEHWNNPSDRQYSRNLGTGDGIELVYWNIRKENALSGFYDDFEDSSVDTIWNDSLHTLWKADHPLTFGITESDGTLNIAYTRTAESAEWDNFNFTPPEEIDVSGNPVIILKIKSDVATTFTVKPIYSNGNHDWLQKDIPADHAWHSYTYELVESNYSGGYLQKIYLYFDGGSTQAKSGLVRFDDFQIAGFSISVINLKANLVDSSRITLTWETDDPGNTDHFNIYRSTQMGFTADEQSKIGETADTVFQDTGLVNHTTYYYKVSATDTEGREHPPAEVSMRTSTPGAPPRVEIISQSSDPVGMYDKFEVVVDLLDATYDNPYNPEEIDLHAWFYSPEGDSVKINGFYDNYQGRNQWKIRFAANAEGSWEYRVHATDKDGTGSIEKQSFTAVESAYRGWLHVSPDNPDYLVHNDGTGFYGIAVYYPWNVTESRLDDFAEVNGNIFGYWDCTYDNEGNGGGRYLLESIESGVGRYDQRKAARIDQVLSWAEDRDMKVMLAIWVHGFLRIDGVPWDNGHWYEQNPYSEIVDVEDFYTDSLALSYQEKHHRYMIARWGYSRALGIWEIINEIHGTSGWVASQAAAKQWVERVYAYFKENDPFNRPTTASFGGVEGASYFSETGQTADIVNVHFYEQHGWPDPYPDNVVRSGLANVVSEARKLKSKGDRPAFFGEAGYYTMLADVGTEEYTWEFHNSFWGGLTNGLASTPFWWEFNKTDIFTPLRLQDYRILSQFVAGIDLAHVPFEPSGIDAENVDGYFMSAPAGGFGWIKTYNADPVSGILVYLSGTRLDNGTCRLEWFNTWTGETVDTHTAICVEGYTWGEVAADLDEKDVAIKLVRSEDGASATGVNLFLFKKDTLLPGPYPWSPQVDSTLYKIVCYVTDDSGRLDVSFNGPVDIDMEGEGQPGPFTVDLDQGGTVLDFHRSGSSGATITATADGLDNAMLEIEGITGTAEYGAPAGTGGCALGNNYPDPFARRTTIPYFLPSDSRIKMAVYNIRGELVEVLVDGYQPAGQHHTVWNAERYDPGIYFYRIVIDRYSKVKRCVLLK